MGSLGLSADGRGRTYVPCDMRATSHSGESTMDRTGTPAPVGQRALTGLDELSELRRQAADDLSRNGVHLDTVEDAVLCLSEACANALVHGRGEVWACWASSPSVVVLEVRDEGPGPKRDLDVPDPAGDQDSGRGLFILSRLAATVRSHRTEQVHCLRIVLPTDAGKRDE